MRTCLVLFAAALAGYAAEPADGQRRARNVPNPSIRVFLPPAAANVGMHYDAGIAAATDPVDRLSSRPDAIIFIYAGRFENPPSPPGAPQPRFR